MRGKRIGLILGVSLVYLSIPVLGQEGGGIPTLFINGDPDARTTPAGSAHVCLRDRQEMGRVIEGLTEDNFAIEEATSCGRGLYCRL